MSDIPKAPGEISPEVIGTIKRLMVGDDEYPGDLYDPKCFYRFKTFTEQLHQLGLFSKSVQVDAIFLTYKSAIPLADAVRGAFQAAGSNTPTLSYINSNHISRQRYNQNPQSKEEEIERLSAFCGSTHRTVVIDQYYYTGDSLNYSVRLLREAGFTHVGEVSGRWYTDLGPVKVSLNDMNSEFSDEFNAIGKAAFEASPLALAA